MNPLLVYLLSVNALGFVLMLSDKKKAQKNHYRIPERTLIFTAIVGGSLGCYLGMQLFRHKTKHPLFYIGIPVILAIQILLAVLIQ